MLIGLVGKPSSGKSTVFKSMTLADVDIGPYPFVTVKPNTGVGYVRVQAVCREFGLCCSPREGFVHGDWRFVPVQVMDVAGLVPGAHEGRGMGNQFLDDLRQAHALIHVVDISGATNEKGEAVPPGTHDPANDILFLERELDMWYFGIIRRGWEKFARTVQQEQNPVERALGKQLSGLRVTEEMVKECAAGLKILEKKPSGWSDDELLGLATLLRRKTKPMVILCNKIDTKAGQENWARIQRDFSDRMLAACSAESELALKEAAKKGLISYTAGENDFSILKEDSLSPKQKSALGFIKGVIHDYGAGVQQALENAVFRLLGHIAVFPAGVGKLQDSEGNVLRDCYLMPPGSTAIDFAYRIHSDFGRGFIKAVDVRTKRPVGRDHKLRHLDMIEIFYK